MSKQTGVEERQPDGLDAPQKGIDNNDELLFPHDFSQLNHHGLRLNPHSYSFYRSSMLVVATALFTLLMLYGPELRNFAYLTYWGFTTCLIYFLVAATEGILLRTMGPTLNFSIWKFLHLVYLNLLGVEVMINGVFWFVFFPFILHYHHQSRQPLNMLDITQAIGAHLVPLTMLLVDGCNNLICFWNRHPRRYLITIMLIYLGFNMIYTLELGPIYPVLTYRDYLTYVFVGGNVIGAYVCYEILFFFSRRFKNAKVQEMLSQQKKAYTRSLSKAQLDGIATTANIVAHVPFVEQK